MSSVSVTSKGQVTIPKHIRRELGITTGSKVEFDLAGSAARMRLVRKGRQSSVAEGPAILDYQGPRIAVGEMDGAKAMKKAARRARD